MRNIIVNVLCHTTHIVAARNASPRALPGHVAGLGSNMAAEAFESPGQIKNDFFFFYLKTRHVRVLSNKTGLAFYKRFCFHKICVCVHWGSEGSVTDKMTVFVIADG